MKPIPLPSHVHYELILQLLERRSLSAVRDTPESSMLQEQMGQLIVTLRKALAQQKQLEAICDQTYVPFEYRWSLNSVDGALEGPSEEPLPQKSGTETRETRAAW